jgi:hypothetical protein
MDCKQRIVKCQFGGNPIFYPPHNVDQADGMSAPEQSPGVVMRTRIDAVIDYLKRIQQN